MDIDFIKWMVEMADGFEMFDKDIIRYRYNNLVYDWIISGEPGIKAWCYYPLLLQRACESLGVQVFESRKGHWKFRYKNTITSPTVFYTSADQAKVEALIYIYQ